MVNGLATSNRHRLDNRDQLVPGIARDPAVDITVGDDLDIALAERDGELKAVAVVQGADDAGRKFAVASTATPCCAM